jgi:hypothetical protein
MNKKGKRKAEREERISSPSPLLPREQLFQAAPSNSQQPWRASPWIIFDENKTRENQRGGKNDNSWSNDRSIF